MNKLKRIINQFLGIKKGNINYITRFDLGSESITSPISEDIDEDLKTEVIITTTKGDVIVFTEEQQIKWKYKVNEQISKQEEMFLDAEKSNSINHAPLVKDIQNKGKKQIIFGTEYGTIIALNHEGKEIWKYKTNHAIRGAINYFNISRVNKTGIIFGSTDKNIYLLSSEGKLLRKFLNDSEIESTPIIEKNNIIFGDNEGRIKSLDLKGRVNWVFKTQDKIVTKPLVTELLDGKKVIIVTSTDKKIYCISLEGELLWSFKTKGALYSEPAILDINDDGQNEIIFGSTDGNIYVLTMDGNELWTYETDFWVIGKPIPKDVDRDGAVEVIVGSYDNNLYVLSGKGLYIIEYVPGLSGIVAQNGNCSDIPSNNPGELIGDKVWEYSTGGLVIGCTIVKDKIVVQTKEGIVLWLNYEEGK